ncbi:MAG: B12-binding domain-containing radical SAM protein [Spirochaetota bacterium]|nr:B12-binding domain-containing radical SAM protein [Spirochaetota bacterium]
MSKKILLISPTVTLSETTRVKSPPAMRIPPLSLAILASITPDDFEIEVIDEEVENIDYDINCDLVGISCMTSNAPRAYEVGKEFKKRGKTVVYGGVHPSCMPNEALQYGDSVVSGEAEGAWEVLLEDYRKGELKPIYRNFEPDLSGYPLAKRDLVKRKGVMFDLQPIITTRGCPYSCEFCYSPEFYGRTLRHIPTDRVIEDIVKSNSKIAFFLDDNIIGKPSYAKELFTKMKPLNIKWGAQASISFVKDGELMKLARDSGCGLLFFGLETVSKDQLKNHRKGIKEINKLEDSIKRVQDLGIHFHASIVFGFDDDTESVFDDTLEFLIKNKIGSLNLNMLTPFPGTRLYKRFKEENRLLTENWRYFDCRTVVIKPKNMTPMQLFNGFLKVKTEFSSFSSILKRFPSKGNWSHPLLYAALNLGFRSTTKKQVKTRDEKMEDVYNSPIINSPQMVIYENLA